MFTITTATRTALNCALLIALAAPFAASAAAPAPPVVAPPVAPPPKPPPPGSNPYQPVVQDDVTGAYQFRTRILVSPPSCERFAAQADWMFLSTTIDDKTKAEQLKRIEAETAAGGCLGR